MMTFLVHYGYWLLFAAVFIDQLGLPLPSVPLLLMAGALSRSGQLSFAMVLVMAVIASVLPHLGWYIAGLQGGGRVLKMICQVSLEPDACVRRTENMFTRYGPKSLLVAPFVPGLGLVAQPLAGMSGTPFPTFLSLNVVGSLFWATTFAGVGYVFSSQLELVARVALRLGAVLVLIALSLLSTYVAWKFIQRQRLFRELRVARITPEELKRKLDQGEPVAIIDLRHAIDFASDARLIPGAVRISLDELAARDSEIPRDRELVLYCT